MFDVKNFWVQVLLAWSEINYGTPQNKGEVLEEIIWYNSHIQIGGKPVFWKKWFENNVIFISDICDPQGFLKQADSYDWDVPWLEVYQLHASLPQDWKAQLSLEDQNGHKDKLYDTLYRSPKVTQKAYELMVEDPEAVRKY